MQSVPHVSSKLTSTMEHSKVVGTYVYSQYVTDIHTDGTARFSTSLGARFGANSRCYQAFKAPGTPPDHPRPSLSRPRTTRPISGRPCAHSIALLPTCDNLSASASHTHSVRRAPGSLSVAAVNCTHLRVVEDSDSDPPTPSRRSRPAAAPPRRPRDGGSDQRCPASPWAWPCGLPQSAICAHRGPRWSQAEARAPGLARAPSRAAAADVGHKHDANRAGGGRRIALVCPRLLHEKPALLRRPEIIYR